jgi:cardiolipin synthase
MGKGHITGFAALAALAALPCCAVAAGTDFDSGGAAQPASSNAISSQQVPQADMSNANSNADWQDYISRLTALIKGGGLHNAGVNDLRLLVDGAQVMPSVKQDILNAKSFVDIEVFQFEPDQIGGALAALLARKVQQGVHVRIILDYYGSFVDNSKDDENKLVDSMRKAGIEVQVRPYQLLHLDHRKVMVMDDGNGGLLAYTGGMNIGRHYQQLWHDQQTRVVGPAVTPLHQSFLDDWKKLTGQNLSGFTVSAPPQSGAQTYVITHVGGDTDENIKQAYLLAIKTARRSIRIEDPYFTDDDILKALMGAAALPGMKVQLIVPKQDDEMITLHAFRAHYPDLIKAGVEVYEYQPRMEHRRWTISGSRRAPPISTTRA